ncbi:Down syndrome cell adhesion molecule-like protein 1 [Schistocerca serialis cubense]|uniref:Down syndrome cell adhesion molecule-like protein 1 n=1 Tax=Schistocerca serialis cubense TaxID=2023355 RepID=UPI00214E29C5|nr:Down syndrome cell adhesion molecule-like protein 1 [Schistocerca serialis cubense]
MLDSRAATIGYSFRPRAVRLATALPADRINSSQCAKDASDGRSLISLLDAHSTRADGYFAYRWYRGRGGQTVAVATDERVIQVGGSLYLRSAQLEDSGRYTCVVNNSVGSERASTSLLVTKQLSAYMSPQVQVVDVGKTAVFNCTTDGHPKQSVVWLKDAQLLTPSSRVRLLASETLKIVHVERSDRGMYQCVVSNAEETAQGTAQLKLGDATPVLLRTFANATLAPGSAWSAQCEASGSPAPAVSWALDGAPLESSPGGERVAVSNRVTADGVLSYLNVSALAPEHGGRYVCSATNAVGSVTHQAYLYVLGPPYIKPMQDRRVVAGTTVTFNCYVTGYPISSIYWEKDGRPLTDTHRQTLFPNGTLLINDVRKMDDEGGYVCVARNPDGDTARRKLNVQVMVPPTWRHEPNDTEVVLGSSLMVDCAADGSPLPSILWRKESPVPRSPFQNIQRDENFKVLENGSLWIQHVLLEDKGYYVCEANSGIGLGLSKGIYITVHVPARFSSEFRNVTAKKDSTAILDCVAEGDKPLKVQWIQANRLVQPNHVKLDIKEEHLDFGLRSKMTIKHVQRDDSATFGCLASNQYGSDRMEFQLIVQENPEPPVNVHLINFSSRSLNISWEMPYNGNSPIHTFIIQIKNTSGNLLEAVN